MSLDTIVQLTVSITNTTLTRPGFGTPLGLVSKVPAGWGPALVQTFSELSELTDLGFTSTDAGYKLAQAITSQEPRPTSFKLAKRAHAPSQVIHLQCLSANPDDVYALSAGVGNGPVAAVTYTVPSSGSPTTTTVAAAIAALISALSGVAATSTTDTIAVTPETAGTLVNLKGWAEKGQKHFTLTDITADPGVETDLDAIWDEDSDWYGLLLDSNGKAEVESAAAWTQANKRLMGYTTSDTGCASNSVTNDVASDLVASAYDRVFGLFQQKELLSYGAAAWMSVAFAYDPGSITWCYKTLLGITVDKLTTGEQTAIEAKNLNHYQAVAGKNVTADGKLASGEFIDVTHGLDWFESEMQLQIFATIAGLPKVPFTASGLNTIENTGNGVMRAAVGRGVFADDKNLYFQVPDVDSIDATTRAQRLCPNIKFGARLAGAIQKTQVKGEVTH